MLLLLYLFEMGEKMNESMINNTLENFFICTNLPILALSKKGKIIGSFGYNTIFQQLLDDNKVTDLALEYDFSLKSHRYNIQSYKGEFHFTLCYIDSIRSKNCIYILGPHSCGTNHALGIVHKPKCLIPNLLSLLYELEQTSLSCSHYHCQHSYHIKKAIDCIHARYDEDISLDDVATYLDLSKSYFCTLLKRETGKTFTSILNEIRIEKSKSLLLEDHTSILDVALASGFNNQNYYNITFKKLSGMTPLEYKKKYFS